MTEAKQAFVSKGFYIFVPFGIIGVSNGWD